MSLSHWPSMDGFMLTGIVFGTTLNSHPSACLCVCGVNWIVTKLCALSLAPRFCCTLTIQLSAGKLHPVQVHCQPVPRPVHTVLPSRPVGVHWSSKKAKDNFIFSHLTEILNRADMDKAFRLRVCFAGFHLALGNGRNELIFIPMRLRRSGRHLVAIKGKTELKIHRRSLE